MCIPVIVFSLTVLILQTFVEFGRSLTSGFLGHHYIAISMDITAPVNILYTKLRRAVLSRTISHLRSIVIDAVYVKVRYTPQSKLAVYQHHINNLSVLLAVHNIDDLPCFAIPTVKRGNWCYAVANLILGIKRPSTSLSENSKRNAHYYKK